MLPFTTSAPCQTARHRTAPVAITLCALLLASLTGCASGPQSTLSSGGASTMVLSEETGRSATVSGEDASVRSSTVAAPVEDVWNALQKVLPAIGIPLKVADRATWTAGNPGFGIKSRFDGRRISTFLKCGGSAGVIEVADEHYVTLGAMTTLRPTATGTEMHVRILGSAKDPFTSVPPRQCSSTGKLEAKLDSAVRAFVQRS